MKLGSFEARFSFGLLVISDPESRDSHDGWDPSAEQVHAGPDSLYVVVRDRASGLVSVACHDDSDSSLGPGSGLLFAGNLELPSAMLMFYDPDQMICMTVPVDEKRMHIKIYSDDPKEPAELLVQVEPHSRTRPGAVGLRGSR